MILVSYNKLLYSTRRPVNAMKRSILKFQGKLFEKGKERKNYEFRKRF